MVGFITSKTVAIFVNATFIIVSLEINMLFTQNITLYILTTDATEIDIHPPEVGKLVRKRFRTISYMVTKNCTTILPTPEWYNARRECLNNKNVHFPYISNVSNVVRLKVTSIIYTTLHCHQLIYLTCSVAKKRNRN